MQAWSRRSAIGAMVALLASGAAGALPVHAAPALALPQGKMRLSRLLQRDLHDGSQIAIAREWLVEFSALSGGAAILGRQIDVSVSAPQKIAAIAAIERGRNTDGMFPIRLGASGELVEMGVFEAERDVAAAMREAERLIAARLRSDAARGEAMRALADVQQAGTGLLERLPRDLFFPQGPGFSARQPLRLPDGSQGEFEVHYTASAAPLAGWLSAAERRIVTRLSGSERRSRERWQMRPA